ncbi:unnamed protein product [Pleuronectes platessa]|uniref:Uncharacterized protein n=1 Tax=Pleuronectes platessa TaxID=8262 RepID=A0A9N7TR10_PLEPL|nr:unnamed protein product [Pleuronectes platessa]
MDYSEIREATRSSPSAELGPGADGMSGFETHSLEKFFMPHLGESTQFHRDWQTARASESTSEYPSGLERSTARMLAFGESSPELTCAPRLHVCTRTVSPPGGEPGQTRVCVTGSGS